MALERLLTSTIAALNTATLTMISKVVDYSVNATITRQEFTVLVTTFCMVFPS